MYTLAIGRCRLSQPRKKTKIAFACHAGTYQYNRMPIGLNNSISNFQRALDLILSKYKWHACIMHLDDVIIYSKSLKGHIKYVDVMLTFLVVAGVTFKINKFHFFTTTVEFLSHVIKTGELEIDRTNTECLRKEKPLTPKTEL